MEPLSKLKRMIRLIRYAFTIGLLLFVVFILPLSGIQAQINSLGDLQFKSYGTERMRVTVPGWVGIGTASPNGALDVFMTGTSSAIIIPRDTTGNRPAAGFQVNGMLRYNTTNNKFEAYENGAWINLIGTSSQWVTSGGHIYYDSGNVGIGTTNPVRALHVNGPIRVAPASLPGSPAVGDIAIDSGAANALKYYNGSAWVSAAGGSGQWTVSGNDIYYSTGNVGIGTTTPVQPLHVSKDGNTTVRFETQNAMVTSMTSAGPNSAGAGVNVAVGANCTWGAPANATTSNNSYSTCVLPADGLTNGLKLTNFGFSIPAGATIWGIEVTVEAKASGATIQNHGASIVKGGSTDYSNSTHTGGTNLITSDANYTYGSSGDLWANSWTVADINSSGFGVELYFKETSEFSSRTVSVDAVSITVYYAISGAATSNWAVGGHQSNGQLKFSNSTATGTNDILSLDPLGFLDVNGFVKMKVNSGPPAPCSAATDGAIAIFKLPGEGKKICICDVDNPAGYPDWLYQGLQTCTLY